MVLLKKRSTFGVVFARSSGFEKFPSVLSVTVKRWMALDGMVQLFMQMQLTYCVG
jgi:hypothetical protein